MGQTYVRSVRLIAAALVLLLVAIYGFDIGHGFVKDDFAWIASSRVRHPHDVVRFFTDPASGFYRPLVAVSFAIDELLFGLAPRPYAFTNLAIFLVCLTGLVMLMEALGASRSFGVFAAAVWAFNVHGINMALLWISGRSALLLCLFALWSATALAKRRFLLSGVCTLAAMLSKEEAVTLPLILAAWLAVDRSSDTGDAASRARAVVAGAWPSFAALAIYLALRSRTDAMTPATAPWFYQLTADPGIVGRNLLEYADRSLTFAVIALLCLLAAARRRPRRTAIDWRLARFGAIWLAGGFAVTLWLPVRSSLYVCLPSIGAALMTVAVATAVWRDLPPVTSRRTVAAALMLLLLLVPVYRSRNARLASEARLSSRVMAWVGDAVRRQPDIDAIVFIDSPDERPTLWAAFGSLLPEAIALETGRRLIVSFEETPEPDMRRAIPHGARVLRMKLVNGQPVGAN
jgi:hypothetical protein